MDSGEIFVSSRHNDSRLSPTAVRSDRSDQLQISHPTPIDDYRSSCKRVVGSAGVGDCAVAGIAILLAIRKLAMGFPRGVEHSSYPCLRAVGVGRRRRDIVVVACDGATRLAPLYLVGTGLVFLFLALDEYFALHEFIEDWEIRYIGLGTAVVLATLAVAARSTQRARMWHVCLLFGLAISVSGAMVFNALPIACDTMGPFSFDGCLEFYIQEETLELLGIWLTLVAMLDIFQARRRRRVPASGAFYICCRRFQLSCFCSIL